MPNALTSCADPAGGFLATSFTLGRRDNLHKVLLWVHEHTVAGLAIFGLLYVWFTVMFLPPALLAACAGALYGLLRAIPVVWVCAVVSNIHGLNHSIPFVNTVHFGHQASYCTHHSSTQQR
jgi:hypothetical protein